ncbi:MAG: 2-C-methyl-D-erythritol 4-phosphate cytidylyltransferase [Armatimonadetes bacterium]|nr:2-C-methyl-D-erythritol 4-phosphate cytidylyltransferase [Armatimonadota bacterium]
MLGRAKLTTTSALIPAAGSGERFGRGSNKVFCEVAGKPILAHTLSVFESCEAVDEVVLVARPDDIKTARLLAEHFAFRKVRTIVPGGEQRQDSVANGLKEVRGDIVAIHDAARPLITGEIIRRSIEEAAKSGACVVAVPVIDTIKAVSDGVVDSTIDRANLYAVQTPQTFRTDIIREAYRRALEDQVYATDDAALVERLGGVVTIVPGSYDNIKITTPADLEVASVKLGGGEVRTGIGYDVHAFTDDRKLVLGGVEVDFEKGLAGHSDADVLIHAIMDALLGAASLGDIGCHFPDSDSQYKEVSSLKLLEQVGQMLSRNDWKVLNVDAVVICEEPKIAPFSSEMSIRIANCLGIDSSRVSVKGTTTEGLGFTGRGEGISCQAVATIARP